MSGRDAGLKERWAAGETAHFEYHCWRSHDSADAELWYHDHQEVVVLGVADRDGDGMAAIDAGLSIDARIDAGTQVVYRVRFADGHEHDVFEDELFTSPTFFDPALGPPPTAAIEHARHYLRRKAA